MQPYGTVPRETLTLIARELRAVYATPVRISSTIRRLTDGTYRVSRDQHRADLLLDRVTDDGDPGAGRAVVAVTPADIFEPGYNFLFGLSYVGGGRALVALGRLNGDDPSQGARRAAKIAVHEAGHALGLEHCRSAGCVMRYSDTVASLDRETGRLCRRCRSLLAA